MRDELACPDLRPPAGILKAEPPFLDGTGRFLLKALILTLGRLVKVEGAERLARISEPAIFALNHSNAVEAVLAPAMLIHLRGGRPVHFLADWMYLQIPVLGGLIRLAEPIPVYGKPARWRWHERYRQQRRAEPIVETCLARLATGGSLGIFPEGTRNPDPVRLRRGRNGIAEIVLRSNASVMPIGIHYPASERLGRAPRLGRMVLRVGEPLHFRAERQAVSSLAPEDLRARMPLIRGVVGRVMAALEELSGKAYESQDLKRRLA